MNNDRYDRGARDYDESLSQIKGLTWLPWIGDNFSKASRKILLVAESHYTKNDNAPIEEAKNILKKDNLLTREVIVECPINGEWQNNMFDNLHRCLVGTTDFNTSELWDEVAFYNFVQKPMDYNGEQGQKERPSRKDFLQGWGVFVEIIKVLKPTDCIFIGVTASNTFDQYMDFAQIKYSPVKWLEGRGAYGRKFALSLDDYFLNCVGVMHTSKFFSWEFWNKFLWRHSQKAMKYIEEHVENSIRPSGNDNPQVDNSWIKAVPVRKHIPIIACKYDEIDEYGDAKYLTVGKAQYDNDNDASVKVWRWDDNNTKWSRQSEELPISRVFDVAVMLASTIQSIQSGKNAEQSYLGEEILKEEDIAFLELQINNRSQHIRQSIQNLKAIINKIDIDAI